MEIVDMFITIILYFGGKSRSVNNRFQQSHFGSRWGFHPPGQPSRKDELTPAADLSISPSPVEDLINID
jgi:hypothetical protein